MDPDKDLVYGPIADNLVFMPRPAAERLIAVRGAINSSRTWGEFKQAMPADSYQHVVELMREAAEEDTAEDEELPDHWEPDGETAFDAEQIPGFADGDWPEWPAQAALEWVPKDIQRRFGVEATSFHSGDSLELAIEQEAAIVAAFVEHGYTCSRDDTLLLRAYDYV